MDLLRHLTPGLLLLAASSCSPEIANITGVVERPRARAVELDTGDFDLVGSFNLNLVSENVDGRVFLHAFGNPDTRLVGTEPPGPWLVREGATTRVAVSWERGPFPQAPSDRVDLTLQLFLEGRGLLSPIFISSGIATDEPPPPPPPAECTSIVGEGVGGFPVDTAWANRIGGPGDIRANGVATGPSGETVVVGSYVDGELTVGPLRLLAPQSADAFVVKLDPTGGPEWLIAFGANQPTPLAAREVALDGQGNIYVAGQLDPATSSLTLVKLDPQGQELWRRDLEDAGWSALAVDAVGGPILGTACGDLCGASASPSDMAVTRFDGAGVHQWSLPLVGTNLDVRVKALDVRDDGGVIVAGDLRQENPAAPTSIDFGGGPLVEDGVDDMFLLRLTATGDHVWSRRFGERGPLSAEDVTLRSDGNILLAGALRGEVDFGGGPMTSATPTESHAFLVELDAQADFVRQLATSGTGIDTATDVEVRADGRVALLGTFEQSFSLGGFELGSGGGSDIFQLELTPTWTVDFGRRFGEGCPELDPSMALTGDAVVLVANSSGRIDFGIGLFSSVARDAYVARFP